ncbi:Orexin receptor type 2 [Bienertia sinuspersici]
MKTIEQHYDQYQVDILKLSEIGKEARSLQCQTHIIGANSHANMRVDYEDEHGKPMGLIKAWERSHMRKDGSFVEGMATEDFLLCSNCLPLTIIILILEEALFKIYTLKFFYLQQDAKAKVETLKLSSPSTSCKDDLEDEAFHDVMNGGKIHERSQDF